jgi:hypothetical protein
MVGLPGRHPPTWTPPWTSSGGSARSSSRCPGETAGSAR